MYMGSNAIRDRDFSVKFLHTGSKEMNNLIDIYNSMINTLGQERTTAEEQSIFLENLISISPVGIIILDFDGRIEILNKHAKQLLNQKSNPIGILLSEIMHPVISGILKIESGQSLIIKADGNKKIPLSGKQYCPQRISPKIHLNRRSDYRITQFRKGCLWKNNPDDGARS